jgi:uncharacterized membrane protein YgdD (TMEM256/DUF423 family)
MMNKQAIVFGAAFAAIAVILGAFGAHALKAVMTPDKLIHVLHLLALGFQREVDDVLQE